MPPAQPRFEEVAGQRLPLGGRNGYLGVRGGQGRKGDKFQGTTPRKQHRTRLCHSAQEAAIALAQVKEDLELGMFEERGKKKAQPAATIATSTKKEAGVYLGRLLQLPRADVLCVRAVLLSEQQAAAAAARGVAVAYADVLP
jgi:hypothetical protein